MWQKLLDTFNIHERFLIRVINRSLTLVLLNLTTNLLTHLIVNLMPWASRNNTTLDRATNKRKVSKHIKKLMSCRLIREDDRRIIDIA